MATTRPPECPICGHDRLRRQTPKIGSLAMIDGSTDEAWTCGLCRHEWSVPSTRAPVLPPRMP